MNSSVNWQDGGCIVNLYCVKVLKNAKIALGVHIMYLIEKESRIP